MPRLLTLALILASLSLDRPPDAPGILIIAHGGDEHWNTQVTTLAGAVNAVRPTEVAFGMAQRATLQAAADRLVDRGVTEIAAVPLFVSSWSSVMESTAYLLGQRSQIPESLVIFAQMGLTGHQHANASNEPPPSDHHDQLAMAMQPITSEVPIRLTSALDAHPVVADILLSRIAAISQTPTNESVIVVAHGPVEDADNARWLASLEVIARQIQSRSAFHAVDVMTLRDDAPPAVRDGATAALRDVVTRHSGAGRHVLVVPLLVSFGGIERGIRERLVGLDHTMTRDGLVPDHRLVRWILGSAGGMFPDTTAGRVLW